MLKFMKFIYIIKRLLFTANSFNIADFCISSIFPKATRIRYLHQVTKCQLHIKERSYLNFFIELSRVLFLFKSTYRLFSITQ